MTASQGALLTAETVSGGEIADFWILGPLAVLAADTAHQS